MEKDKNTTGHVIALFTIIIWGTTFISTKILLREFTPFEILFIRFVISIVALTIAAPSRMIMKNKKHEIIFVFAGLTGITLYYLLENIALTYSMASNIGVVLSVAPMFTAILAHFFLEGEKLRFNFFLGFLVAIVGICIISFDGSENLRLNPIGDFLAILAAFVWAIYSILTRKISTYGYNTIHVTRRTFLYGILFMIPAMFIFGFDIKAEQVIKPVNLFNILFLGLGASALCFVTWNYAVKLLGAVKTSVYIYLVPVVTVITSILVLHEKITRMAAIGMILTLLGLVISESKFRLQKGQKK
ncbi:MAG TPA: DMT family transporter [Mobilitalea sp.]|nr:DMT family transporter [Mobilitalea sp.]